MRRGRATVKSSRLPSRALRHWTRPDNLSMANRWILSPGDPRSVGEVTVKRYRDLREHLRALEQENLLQRVARPINKDTELFPLVRWQFRGGIREDQRRGWLFENVMDSKNKRYSHPFALGVLASSRKIYGIGLECRSDSEILEKWRRALSEPLAPEMVGSGPVHDLVIERNTLAETDRGFDSIPVPISTP